MKSDSSIRMELNSLQAVFYTRGSFDLDKTLDLVQGIGYVGRVSAKEIVEDLPAEQKKARFSLRGVKWQLFDSGVRDPDAGKIGRRVHYANHPEATHRVMVYAYAGREVPGIKYVDEFFEEDENGKRRLTWASWPAYDMTSFMVTPLAKVDVRVPLSYIKGRFRTQQMKEAVKAFAEKMALKWYERFLAGLGRDLLSEVQYASGVAAMLLRPLVGARDKRRQEVWDVDKGNAERRKLGPSGTKPRLGPVEPPSRILPGEVEAEYRRSHR